MLYNSNSDARLTFSRRNGTASLIRKEADELTLSGSDWVESQPEFPPNILSRLDRAAEGIPLPRGPFFLRE